MTDDPREVLKAAGVKCFEVDEYSVARRTPNPYAVTPAADAAILALARLVAKYEWMRGSHPRKRIGTAPGPMPWVSKDEMIADLARRWEEGQS